MPAIHRPAQLLQLWQDTFFLASCCHNLDMTIGGKAVELTGAVVCSQAFRGWLLSGNDSDINEFGYEGEVELLTRLQPIPFLLTSWVRESKRAFEVVLNDFTEGYGGMAEGKTWAEVVWPHETFLLTMDKPVGVDDCGPYDAFLVAGGLNDAPGEERGVVVVAIHLPEALENYEPLTPEDKNYLFRETLNRDVREKLLKALWTRTRDVVRQLGFTHGLYKPEEILPGRSGDFREQIAALAVRLSHGNVRAAKSTGSQQPPEEAPTPGYINDPARVCDVEKGSVVRLGDLLAPDLGHQQAVEVSPHKRRAHLRRPKGSPPDAPKCIVVGECWVRKDKLGFGTVVEGTASKLSVSD